MSNKKRTTVTTIETHEVWVIRKVVPDPLEEAVTITPVETVQPAPVPPSREFNNGTETNEEESANEQRITVPQGRNVYSTERRD